jgi:hypothetical protein
MSKILTYGATRVDGTTAVASLEPFQWKNRILAIFTDRDNSKASRQENLLLSAREGLAERDMVVLRIDGETVRAVFGAADALSAVNLRSELEAPDVGVFAAILVGKDGSVKLRAVEPLMAEELFDTIDGMPMRAAETTRNHEQ